MYHLYKPISPFQDRIKQFLEFAVAVGVLSRFGGWVYCFPEGSGESVDFNGLDSAPLLDGEIELLGDSEGGEIPGVTVEVDVFRVAACSYRRVRGDFGIQGVNRTEGINVDFEVGEGAGRAWLKEFVFTWGLWVET